MGTELKANKLRIGNKVDIYGSIATIVPSDFQKWIDIKDNSFIMRDIKPIELTEEWLVKFGFIKENKKQSNKHDNYFNIGFEDSNISLAYANFRNDYGFYIEYTDSPFEEDEGRKYFVSHGIKYVHQLQNLYFCLTNTELCIK